MTNTAADDHSSDSDLHPSDLEEDQALEEAYAERPRRFWFYKRSQWEPSWWHRWGLPAIGGTLTDEWGRRTLVWGTGLTGYICVVWRTCWCRECHWVRSQTYGYARPALDRQMREHWMKEDDDARSRKGS